LGRLARKGLGCSPRLSRPLYFPTPLDSSKTVSCARVPRVRVIFRLASILSTQHGKVRCFPQRRDKKLRIPEAAPRWNSNLAVKDFFSAGPRRHHPVAPQALLLRHSDTAERVSRIPRVKFQPRSASGEAAAFCRYRSEVETRLHHEQQLH